MVWAVALVRQRPPKPLALLVVVTITVKVARSQWRRLLRTICVVDPSRCLRDTGLAWTAVVDPTLAGLRNSFDSSRQVGSCHGTNTASPPWEALISQGLCLADARRLGRSRGAVFNPGAHHVWRRRTLAQRHQATSR